MSVVGGGADIPPQGATSDFDPTLTSLSKRADAAGRRGLIKPVQETMKVLFRPVE
jgi:hypothetical protein